MQFLGHVPHGFLLASADKLTLHAAIAECGEQTADKRELPDRDHR
jgi:hypothetical protein